MVNEGLQRLIINALMINATCTEWGLESKWVLLSLCLGSIWAVVWNLKNGLFSTIFKTMAEIAILSYILTPKKS